MSRFKTIAVIYGSDSSEWEVSCRSGEYVASLIDGDVYDVYEIFARFGKWSLVAAKKKDSMRVTFPEESRPQIDKTDFSVTIFGEKVKFDYAYIMQHGAPGENGQLQGYLQMLGIKFSTCDAYTSTIAFDKYACKSFVRGLEIVNCAKDMLLREGQDIETASRQVARNMSFPVFVKPTQGGSSFGVTMVKKVEDIVPAVKFAFSENPVVIIEQGVSGRELTCAVFFNGKEVQALPVIEIVSENEYFDYDAKYNGHSAEICPAAIPDEVRELVQEKSRKLYEGLGCKGVVRMDYILADDGLYFLEINAIPGMTSASLVPKMVRSAGLGMTEFLSTIIENS